MSFLKPLIIAGLLATAGGFASDFLCNNLGPAVYNGFLVFEYGEGENPVNNIVFTVDSQIAGNLIIIDVPSPWSYTHEGDTLTLSGGSLSPGSSVRVTVSLNKYYDEGEYSARSMATTTMGDKIQSTGSLAVGNLSPLTIVETMSTYRVPLAGFVLALGATEYFLTSRIQLRDPMQDVWRLVEELKKLEKEKARMEKELEDNRKQIEKIKDEIKRDEQLRESIEDDYDGEGFGAPSFATNLKKEIAAKKLRVAELENLDRYHQSELKKLEQKISNLKAEMERLQRGSLPPI
ncbi:MAG: hypothetical protein NWF07_07720 [Candidatus Bathyarchaeota archaeon]|nr:hypothetical protein [Candidatus Bathyarchaeota archaeon]